MSYDLDIQVFNNTKLDFGWTAAMQMKMSDRISES